MNSLKTMKQVYLSKDISDSDKKLITQSYFRVKSSQLTSKVDKQLDDISRKYLERYYKKILGDSWRDLVKKYKIHEQTLYLISEPFLSKTESLSNKYFDRNYFDTSGLKYHTPEEYPITEDRVTNVFDKCKSKKKMISLLYEKQNIKDTLVSEMFTRGIINQYSFLPGINTYEDLYLKYPDVFDLWIQDRLQVTTTIGVEVITVEEEINKLKNFLEC